MDKDVEKQLIRILAKAARNAQHERMRYPGRGFVASFQLGLRCGYINAARDVAYLTSGRLRRKLRK